MQRADALDVTSACGMGPTSQAPIGENCLLCQIVTGNRRALVPEPVKTFETSCQDFFCVSLVMVGLLIQATVGSLGGVGRRPQKRCGLAA
jgi:hypothetical protein